MHIARRKKKRIERSHAVLVGSLCFSRDYSSTDFPKELRDL